MEFIFSFIGIILFLWMLVFWSDIKDDYIVGWIFLVLVCFIPLGIYSIKLNFISQYTVKEISVISSEDKIYEVKLIKDPGKIFFDHEYMIYTTKSLSIGDRIQDVRVRGKSLIHE